MGLTKNIQWKLNQKIDRQRSFLYLCFAEINSAHSHETIFG